MGREIALIFILAMSLGLPESSEAAGEGGPSTFGYDASSACGKPYSRVGRSRLNELPCDFRRENWCAIAGNAYPWQAVRRFVQENQGLMRRMYGDEKHISVLKTELEKNDVELELEDDHNHLYSDDANTLFRQFPIDPDYDLAQGRPSQSERDGLTDRDYAARSLNTGTSSKFDKPKAEDPPTRYSHPNETPTASTTAHTASSTSTVTTSATTSATSTTSNPSTATTATRTITSQRRRMSPVTTTTTTTTIRASTMLASTNPTTSTTTSSTTTKEKESEILNLTSTTPVVMLSEIAKIQNLSINEIPGQIDRFDVDVDELTEIPEILVEDLPETTLPVEDNGDTFSGYSTAYISTSSERIEEFKNEEKDQIAEASEPSQQQQQQQQQFRPRPEYRPPDTTKPEPMDTMEGQLFQDVAAKDKQEPPVLKVRGINACPVKEEVVAPFWANNTRGEVLALLNLYPFEQYVHWEKCTHENKQMYCRDGCRCEQQYRLHRLLAYDPNNECRGIFSDWFKFPSCCICRCYDLPLEFRVTSRSPRIVQRQRLKVRAPRAPPRQRLYN